MQAELTMKRVFDIKTLVVDAGVRYWEDSTINGENDITLEEQSQGGKPRMPFAYYDEEKKEYRWRIEIDLDSMTIQGWPSGTMANVFYKVCDDGTYTLKDADGNAIVTVDSYVPDFLGEDGDYLTFRISKDGRILDTSCGESDLQELIDRSL